MFKIKGPQQILCLFLFLLCSSIPALASTSELNTKLYQAVLFQDPLQVRALLGQGADPNYKESGRALIAWAAQSGNVEVVEILLGAKADPNVSDEGTGHSALMRAIDMQQVAVVNVLLKAKANPNYKTAEGKTCLDLAVGSRKPEIVDALIKAGADVKYVTPEGDSPALTAAQEGTAEGIQMIMILGKAGANMNASNAAYTPLYYASEQGNVELVKALLEAGADPNAKTQGGSLPIHAALDNKEVLDLLLKAKANPDSESAYGTTPIFAAIENGYKDAVELLLNAGADTNRPNASGTTPIELANQYSQPEVAALISAHNAKANLNSRPDLAKAPDPSN